MTRYHLVSKLDLRDQFAGRWQAGVLSWGSKHLEDALQRAREPEVMVCYAIGVDYETADQLHHMLCDRGKVRDPMLRRIVTALDGGGTQINRLRADRCVHCVSPESSIRAKAIDLGSAAVQSRDD